MSRLAEQVAIVTGAGQGIGREYALALAREGAAVVVNDLGTTLEGGGTDRGPADAVVREIEAAGGRALADHSDVTDHAAAGRAVERAIEAFGSIDIVIANAAVSRRGPIVECPEATWDAVVGTSLKGTYNYAHHAGRAMREQGHGRLITITSGGCFIPSPRSAPYSAAKAAVLSFTLCVAAELEGTGVTVNCLSPGLTDTRLGEGAIVDITATTGRSREAFYDEVGAPQSPAALAPLAVFLASKEAGSLTGRILEVAGDRIVAIHPPGRGDSWTRPGGWTTEAVFAELPGHLGLD